MRLSYSVEASRQCPAALSVPAQDTNQSELYKQSSAEGSRRCSDGVLFSGPSGAAGYRQDFPDVQHSAFLAVYRWRLYSPP
jgi:hypothetical protein